MLKKHSRITYRVRKLSAFWTLARSFNRLSRAHHDFGWAVHLKPIMTPSSSYTHIHTSTHHQPHHTPLVHSKSHQKLQHRLFSFPGLDHSFLWAGYTGYDDDNLNVTLCRSFHFVWFWIWLNKNTSFFSEFCINIKE